MKAVIDLKAANHTGRELELMLAGKKPLAMFYDEISCLPDEVIIPEESFAPYVERCDFVRGELRLEEDFHPKLQRNAQIQYVFFALSDEAWRIPAMILLLQSFHKSSCGWNETLERIESSLLGYTDEEIDAWCAASPLLNNSKTNGATEMQTFGK